MKSIYKLMFLCLLISFVSCDSITDLNVDPDQSPTARPQELLTSAEGYTSFVIDSRLNALATRWAQYWTWGPGVSLGNSARYVAEPDDHDLLWVRAYSNALADLAVLRKSDEAAFSAVGKILTSYLFQGLVDHFDGVPYTQALKGEIADGSVLAPTFDDPAAIYADLVIQLDEAIAQLATTTGDEIGSEDLIYGGDLTKWATFAKSLKLRILMRQESVVDVAAEVEKLILEGDLIASADEMAQIDFNGQSGDENPMYADFESGIGNFYIASNSSLNVLDALGDPRKAALYDEAPDFPGEIRGVPHGGINFEGFTAKRSEYSQGSAITYGAAVPVIFMSNWEVWFLRAEAAARFNVGDEATAFARGIAASFDQLSVPGAAAYTSTLNYGGSLNERLAKIAVQKWIACNGFQEDEGWIEARRFDTPDNPIFTELNTGIFRTPLETALPPGVHPSIFLYPEIELNLNPNAPNQRTILGKVFWDN